MSLQFIMTSTSASASNSTRVSTTTHYSNPDNRLRAADDRVIRIKHVYMQQTNQLQRSVWGRNDRRSPKSQSISVMHMPQVGVHARPASPEPAGERIRTYDTQKLGESPLQLPPQLPPTAATRVLHAYSSSLPSSSAAAGAGVASAASPSASASAVGAGVTVGAASSASCSAPPNWASYSSYSSS